MQVIASPDQPNIFYAKYFRKGNDNESIEGTLKPSALKLLECRYTYPITIVYLPLRWCGFAYTLFTSILGHKQYYPEDADAVPKYRLFGQFHAPQTEEMKEEILCLLTSSNSTIRVVFATVAMGMGVDISSIRQVIHIGPPHTIQQYYQEGQGVMGSHARRFCTTTTGILQETNQVCKIWYETFVETLGHALEHYCYNIWMLQIQNLLSLSMTAALNVCLHVYVLVALNRNYRTRLDY